MNTTDVKRLLKDWLVKLRERDGGRHLTHRLVLLGVSALLAYLGVDTTDLFDEER